VVEVALAEAAPQRREWSVVCDAEASAAVLAGWERPDGRFEALWSVEEQVVRHASEAARALARRGGMTSELAPLHPLRPALDSARRATAVANRVVAYLDRAWAPGAR
nr:hypothetical protein [Actinomycetota bacterium]